VPDQLDLKEFISGFIAESEQLVASATAGLLELEQANAAGELRPKTVRELFRALHTLKGLAGMMGVTGIVALAHAFETVLRAADQAGGQLSPRAVELGLVAVRGIADRVRAVADNRPVPPAPDSVLDELARVDATADRAAPPVVVAAAWDRRLSAGERTQLHAALQAGRPAYTLTFAPSDASSARGVTIATVRAAVSQLGDIVKVAPRSEPESPEAPAGLVFELLVVSDATVERLADAAATSFERVVPVAIETPAPVVLSELHATDEIAPIGRSFVRVELARLDELQDQLSALVITRFRLERQLATMAADGIDIRALREITDAQGRQLRDLRRGILHARMVRVAEVLEPLSLLVRSLTKPGVKEGRLVLDVRDTELDKAVADRLLPALIHMVRNAIDHAIEPIVEREQASKPRTGTVRITCREGAGNQLELAVSDDGRGIDTASVARRLRRPIESDAELLDAITTPGFSTRDVATETSGRGLGMDIVRRTVSELGGELLLSTSRSAGTTFTLRVPLTIAIIDVFSFECAQQAFVVPVAAIEEILDLAQARRIEGPSAAGHLPLSLLERRGQALTVVPLGLLLRLSRDIAGAHKALVIRRSGEPLAFAVDRMLGRHEVVVRPIEDRLARVPGVAGATDLGDGRPTLLLDLAELGGGVATWREVMS
jgi:two-component system, chemotaxis family, sensor kinase CheA